MTGNGQHGVSPRDVFILGTAYCGSTLLGNALNGHSAVSYAGEVSRLPAFGVGDPTRVCTLCATRGLECPVWSDSFLTRVSSEGPGKALGLCRDALGTPIIVDGSKHVEWLRKVQRGKGLSLNSMAIVSVRSPFAFVSSAKRRAGFEAWQAANIWRDTIFDILRSLGMLGTPHVIVRYEDFASRPSATLERMCSFLGISFERSMLRFWEQPIHALGGNAGAYVWYEDFQNRGQYAKEADRRVAQQYHERKFGGWADEKWREELLPHEISAVLATPSLVDMSSLVGYDLPTLLRTRVANLAEEAPAG